jgi:hypothetical protein
LLFSIDDKSMIFFERNATNNEPKHHQLVHVLPNADIPHGIYLRKNKGWPLDSHGNFQWLHWYPTLHKVGYVANHAHSIFYSHSNSM